MDRPKGRPDSERRKRQSARYARIFALAHLVDNLEKEPSVEQVRQMGGLLGVNERTVYRDLGVIKEAKEMIANLDGGTKDA